MQAYVAGLRKALEPDRAPRTPASILVTVGAGYALRVDPGQLDVSRFAKAVTSQHQRLAPVAGLVPEPDRAGLDHDQLTDAVAALTVPSTSGAVSPISSSTTPPTPGPNAPDSASCS